MAVCNKKKKVYIIIIYTDKCSSATAVYDSTMVVLLFIGNNSIPTKT